jgi:AP-1 complex subunit gamma-1
VVLLTPVNGQPTGTVQSNQDLLAEIFGPSTSISSAPATASSPPSQPQRSKVDDILNLFGTSGGNNLSSAPATPHPSVVPPSYTSPPSSLFTPTQAQSQSPPTPAVAAQPRLTSYTAYDKNDIKITLTPQTSAARPGVVMILARFQVSGSEPATGLSFQAAVPKVCMVLKLSKFQAPS